MIVKHINVPFSWAEFSGKRLQTRLDFFNLLVSLEGIERQIHDLLDEEASVALYAYEQTVLQAAKKHKLVDLIGPMINITSDQCDELEVRRLLATMNIATGLLDPWYADVRQFAGILHNWNRCCKRQQLNFMIHGDSTSPEDQVKHLERYAKYESWVLRLRIWTLRRYGWLIMFLMHNQSQQKLIADHAAYNERFNQNASVIESIVSNPGKLRTP